jgi:hypothetical protein
LNVEDTPIRRVSLLTGNEYWTTEREIRERREKRALVNARVNARFSSGRLYKNRKPDSSGIYAYGIVR